MSDMYVSLYLEALKRLMGTGDRAAQDVLLMSLCQHANTFGWCYPGDDLISAESCHRKDAIPDVLTRLELLSYIRLVYTPTPRRSAPQRDIQINPYLIALRPECHEVSAAEWDGYKSQNGGNGKQTIPITYGKSDLQPPYNHLHESPSRITTTEPPPYTTTRNSAFREQEVQKNEDSAALPAPQAQELPVPTAQNASANAPRPPFRASPSPTNAGPIQMPEVQLYKEPLPDELYERVALTMNEATGRGMSLAIARGLVMQHGTAVCTAATKLLTNKRGLTNPAGHLRWTIQMGKVDPLGDARPERNPYIPDKYSDVFDH